MPGALFGLVAAIALVGGIAVRFHHDVVRIYEARDRLHHRGALLVDVDPSGDFAQRHPRLAVSIPLEELARRAHELGPTDTPIVVYAHRWRDGAKAVHLLRAHGYQDVFDAAGLRTMEKLGAAAAHAEASRTRFEGERGVPEDVELAPSAS